MRPLHPERALALALAALFVAWPANGAPPAPERMLKSLRAARTKAPPRLDGKLDEAMWKNALFIDDFLQKEPDEGEPATQRTEVAVLYDDDALYIGARLYAKDPSKIRALLTRRDTTRGTERFIISLDTYENRRTAYSFAVTAAGVRADWIHPEDSEWSRDLSFNPVWEAGAQITAWGWSCEMRIPFSQLRFNPRGHQSFGVNFNRYSPDLNEDDFWIPVPKKAKGWSSYFGTLEGLDGIEAGRHIELLPYLAGDASTLTPKARDPDDPFGKTLAPAGRFGLDAKFGLGPDLTLDATVNPDFGQVEADSAEVNLSDFETFFEEKRPFFIEGSDLFAGNGPDYFYSRRIGAPPTGRPAADYAKLPRATRILGATKLTGRTKDGLSGGLLLATTARTFADTYSIDTGTFGRERVEPFAGYGILRLEQQIGDNDSTAGITLTTVQRDLRADDALAESLPDRAITGGADFALRLLDDTYQLSGSFGGSTVHGSRSAILDLQHSSARYFQRPDQGHVKIDPDRTSLTGYAANLKLSQVEGEHILWGAEIVSISPGFELNDLGFLQKADQVQASTSLTLREVKPRDLFHRWSLTLEPRARWNHGGVLTSASMNLFGNFTFRNYWGIYFFGSAWAPSMDDRATRGGPLLRTAGGQNAGVGVFSSNTNRVRGNGTIFAGSTGDGGRWVGGDLSFSAELGGRTRLSFTPSLNHSVVTWQYVRTFQGGPLAAFDRSTIFTRGTWNQLVLPVRLEIGLTPDLHLEAYAEFFSTSGTFDDYGLLLDGRSGSMRWFGETGDLRRDRGMVLLDNGDRSYVVPDFNLHFASIRSNLVLRWEWLPGSTLYLVWQQDRAFASNVPLPVLEGLGRGVTGSGQHIFALKAAYWFGL